MRETWVHGALIGVDDWQLSTAYAHSPTHSYYASDPDALKDAWLATRAILVPANGRLTFWHTYDFELHCDGGVLEISTDGGATFADLGESITSGGYNSALTCSTNPIVGRMAWTGGGLGAMSQVVVDLSAYAGQSVIIRFRLVADDGVGGGGWYLDDVRVESGSEPTATPTATPTSISTSTPTSTPTATATTTPTPTPTATPGGSGFWDDFDPVRETWVHGALIGVDDWQLSTAYAHSPTHSYYASDPDALKDAWLATRAILVPANGRLTFWHTYDFELHCDGGVLEISTDGGATFADLGESITSGGYNSALTCSTNPIVGRMAWTGGGLGAMSQVVVDLSAYAGQSVMIRFRLVADDGVGGGGWYLDDVRVENALAGAAGGHALAAPAYAEARSEHPFAAVWTDLVNRLLEAVQRLVSTARANLSTPPTGQVWKTYYFAGSQVIAERVATASGDTVYFLHSDHLGSVSLTTDANGTAIARQLYDAWGNVRSGGGMPTDIGYTGQRLDATTGGLMFYGARYYSPYLNRWLSPDTIVPDPKNPQNLNRYSYVNNNPVKYTDPSGHRPCEDELCSPPPSLHSSLESLKPSTSFRKPFGSIETIRTVRGLTANHIGRDYSTVVGTPLYASANGVVIIADACSLQNCVGLNGQTGANVNGGYGNVMVIEYPYQSLPDAARADIGLSEDESLYMLYAHLENAPEVQSGDTVRPGQLIGHTGNTGNSTAAHLHLEPRIGETGSLPFGDMCTTSCNAPTRNDPYPRFDAWYRSGNYRPFDPNILHYYTARELQMMQP